MAGERSEVEELRKCENRKQREKVLAELLMRHRPRLRRMVELRLHPRLRGRIGPSDVMQEAFLDAAKRLNTYLKEPRLPPFLWLRRIVAQKLHDLHRFHRGAKVRDARRESPLPLGGAGPPASSAAMSAELIKEGTSPSDAAVRAERKLSVQSALEGLDAIDREILALRYYERLTSAEAAQVLGISTVAAGKRYERALGRLRKTIGRGSKPATDL